MVAAFENINHLPLFFFYLGTSRLSSFSFAMWQDLFGSDDEDYAENTHSTGLQTTLTDETNGNVETFDQIPGLSLWHGALDHTRQMALIQAIIDADIFGQGNQAMRFGNLGSHLTELAAYIQESNILPASLACRTPLFDQAIYNRYNKGMECSNSSTHSPALLLFRGRIDQSHRFGKVSDGRDEGILDSLFLCYLDSTMASLYYHSCLAAV